MFFFCVFQVILLFVVLLKYDIIFLKVRNKLDERLYAIKRIILNRSEKLLNKKLTREVKLLSRLNHENVVRYYNSWIEYADTSFTESSQKHENEQNATNVTKVGYKYFVLNRM